MQVNHHHKTAFMNDLDELKVKLDGFWEMRAKILGTDFYVFPFLKERLVLSIREFSFVKMLTVQDSQLLALLENT